MCWTSYHATNYKRGNVDRKAECERYFRESGTLELVKGAMRGSVYYAAVKHVRNWTGKADEAGQWIYTDITEAEQKIFGLVMLTRTDKNDYYNFSYKDMTEDMNPFYYDCPASILDLLSPTDDAYALEWREKCRAAQAAKSEKRKDAHNLNNLPVGTTISFPCPFDCAAGKLGEKVTLRKVQFWGRSRPVWYDGVYRWKSTQIPKDYDVLSTAA